MTAICASGGPSGIKAGVTNTIVYSSAAAGLLGLVPGLEFLEAVAILGGALSYDLTTICPADPPGYPTFTAAEILAAATNTIGADLSSFTSKLNQTLTQILWYQFCQCTGGSTPALPAAPAGPSTVTVIDNTVPTTPCIVVGPQGDTVAAGAGPLFRIQAGKVASGATITQNVTSTRVTMVSSVASGTGPTVSVQITHEHTLPSTGTDDTRTYNLTHAQTVVDVLPWNPASSVIRGYINGLTGTGTTQVLITFEQFCDNAQPGGVTQPCCPPDATTVAQLNAILQLTTLIQRQLAPFAYIASTVHSSLSGNGTIAVQGLLGIKIEATTVPSRLGLVAGDPNDLFGAGWVNLGTADGFGPRQFISTSPMIIRPVQPDVTVIGYSIPADVTVSITELVREP